MAYQQATWNDRDSEHPNRRTLTNINDPTDVKTYDISRAEGTVTTPGTPLAAANMNDLEIRIASAFTEVNNNMPVANPSGEATDELEKIKIGNTIFSVEGTEVEKGTIQNVATASFSDGADNVPVSELIVDIEPVQAGSGVPSTTNVRAISGRSACNLTKCGKNLSYANNASFTSGQDKTEILQPEIFLKAGTYTFSFTVSASITSTRNRPMYRTSSGANIYAPSDYNSSGRGSWTFTLSTDSIISLRWWCNNPSTSVTISDFQLEPGTTATSFEEYNGGTDTISLGQTVYGGSLNVTTGLLTITHDYIASYNGETINEPWISSIDEYVPNTSPSTGAEVVYPLSVPTTVQLTPTEVRTLLNDNNIFADTGNINELVYFKTGCETIARLIEAYECYTEVAGTLAAGQTSITLTNDAITSNSTIDVYTDADVDYNSITVATGSVTITFEAQASNLKVKARIS